MKSYRMKIKEAVIVVLEAERRPMTAAELAHEIRSRGLHPLPTKYPASVVGKAIRRCCIGVSTDGSLVQNIFGKSLVVGICC